MGLFDALRKKKSVPAVSEEEKKQHNLNLEKRLDLSKEIIHETAPLLEALEPRVALVLDYSGSMDYDYRSGRVQELLERILPLAINLDDNGELDPFLFHDRLIELSEGVTKENYMNYLDRATRKHHMGGTRYAPIIQGMVNKYVTNEPSETPTLVIIVTDGRPSDKELTTMDLVQASKYNLFFKFISIGAEQIKYLEELDNMEGRTVDNANYQRVEKPGKLSDVALYTLLLEETDEWVKAARAAGILKEQV